MLTNQKTASQNLLYAFGLALFIAGVIAALFTVLSSAVGISTPSANWPEWIASNLFLFKSIFLSSLLCYGPIVFLIAFALLQRFRIKR